MICSRVGGEVDMGQNNFNHAVFTSILSLKKVLGDRNTLQIVHPDSIWIASFSWGEPISQSQMDLVDGRIEIQIPKDLILFWSQISDGALLYYDQKYGQWGYKIYGSKEILDQQSRWKNLFRDRWSPNLTAIGETIDDTHPLIAIFGHNDHEEMDYALFEGNPLDPIDYWKKMAASFSEWIDRLITAQGAKYWDWR